MDFKQFSQNISFNILTCLKFKERYRFCITSKYLFNELFKKYKHQELIQIKFEDHPLTKIWKNIKFKMDLSKKKEDKIKKLKLESESESESEFEFESEFEYENITDVSMLGRVHTLDLSNCQNIRGVSMLGSVHTLKLLGTNIILFYPYKYHNYNNKNYLNFYPESKHVIEKLLRLIPSLKVL